MELTTQGETPLLTNEDHKLLASKLRMYLRASGLGKRLYGECLELLVLACKQEKKKKKKERGGKKKIINVQEREDDYKLRQNDGEEHSRVIIYQKWPFTSLFNNSRKDTIHDIDASSTCSYEDSFISIKFENNNGVGSWEKGAVGTVPKATLKHSENMCGSNNKVAVIEHVASKPRMQLRWRKRIGHIFQLIRLKRSSTKGSNVCHVGTKLERGHGWIRTLTKRKTKE
ncbi:hypothetical protein HAX54_033998 [Datura stramonium]|uniref:Uncharacterized protein n=1 Tax=Datura stramonium TaxID=4076 RepID=A0ABS8VD92_DATST|nr:hypothetical protein [Datura stramonium]